MQKAEKYLQGIIDAKDEDSAVFLLKELALDLGIGQSYGQLVDIKARLSQFKESFKLLQKSLRDETVPTVHFLQDIRQETVVCYQELCDELSSDVNRLKIAFGDDRRSEVRSTVLTRLWTDEEFKKKYNAKSMNAIEKVYSSDSEYKEWLTCSALSYGLWNDYRDTLRYINMFIDGVASQIRTEQNAQRMDSK